MVKNLPTMQTQAQPTSPLLKNLNWLVSWLIAVAALLFILFATPLTQLNLLPGATNNLGRLNGETVIEPTGITALPGNGAASVANGGEIRVTAFSFRPVTLNITVASGQGKLEIASNKVSVAAIDKPDLAGTYIFRFVPQKEDNTKPEIHLKFITSGSTTLTMSQLNLDFAAQWQPWLAARSDIVGGLVVVLLVLLLVAVWLGRRILWISWLGLAGALVGEILLATWLATLLAGGAAGAFNSVIFWELFFAVVYLMGLIAVLGAVVLSTPQDWLAYLSAAYLS